jgi:hypothetical protein
MPKNPKIRVIFLAFLCYGLGTLSGIVLQKCFPIGQVLGIDITGSLHTLTVHNPHQEVPIETIKRFPPKRVMVAIAFGQSNSANLGDVLHTGAPGVYNFYDGKLYKAQDPLIGADGKGGSVWTLLGNKLVAAKRYDAVVLVSLGVGTTEVERWLPDGDLLPNVQKAIRQLKSCGLTPTHLFWHQGETDGRLRTSTKLYISEFLEMLSAIRKMGVTAPIYVCRASRCAKQPPITSVRQAQLELVHEAQGIRAGPDTDALGLEYRHDGCHLSDKGQEKFADLWMEKLK